MAPKPSMLALLLGSPSKKQAPTPEKPKRVSREDLRVAMKEFRGATDDDAAVTALMNFQDLARDFHPDD